MGDRFKPESVIGMGQNMHRPLLLRIVHSFGEGVALPTAAESFEEGWKEVMAGNTHPIETLWDGIGAS